MNKNFTKVIKIIHNNTYTINLWNESKHIAPSYRSYVRHTLYRSNYFFVQSERCGPLAYHSMLGHPFIRASIPRLLFNNCRHCLNRVGNDFGHWHLRESVSWKWRVQHNYYAKLLNYRFMFFLFPSTNAEKKLSAWNQQAQIVISENYTKFKILINEAFHLLKT